MAQAQSIGQLEHQPGKCVSCLESWMDACLLLMDTLEIALVIAELNLLLQLLAGLLVAKVIASSLSFGRRGPRRSLGGSAFPSATAGADPPRATG